MFHVNMASMLRPLRVCDRQKRKRLRNRCFATATDINRCSVARSIEVTMVGRYRSIDRDYQGQLSRRLRSRVLMHAYAQRTRNLLVRCAIISRQLGQGRQRSGGSPLFMINHRSSFYCQILFWRYLTGSYNSYEFGVVVCIERHQSTKFNILQHSSYTF